MVALADVGCGAGGGGAVPVRFGSTASGSAHFGGVPAIALGTWSIVSMGNGWEVLT